MFSQNAKLYIDLFSVVGIDLTHNLWMLNKYLANELHSQTFLWQYLITLQELALNPLCSTGRLQISLVIDEIYRHMPLRPAKSSWLLIPLLFKT